MGDRERGQEIVVMPEEFHCYLVQKIESVFHPAKLACGANYPVGWVQMPHSVMSGGESDGVQRAIEYCEGVRLTGAHTQVLVAL